VTIFARHHMDACCGGAHPIRFSAEKHAAPLEQVMAQLEELAASRPRR
jgi:iron-sulfur cluster repair protein YtfE (RIC family)